MSDTTYILIVPTVGEIMREEFRADESLKQLYEAMKSDHIFSKSDPHISLNTAYWEDRYVEKKLVFENRRVSEILQRFVLGRVVITGLTDKCEVIGLTAEQCDTILERLNVEG